MGERDGVPALPVSCSAPVVIEPRPCAPITGLQCTENAGAIDLSWIPGETYALGIEIERDGAVIASLPGSATTFTDSPPLGQYTYTVRGRCDLVDSTAICAVAVTAPLFVRGDCDPNSNGLAEVIYVLNVLFSGAATPLCLDACDINDSGSLDLADVIGYLGFLFSGGANPAAPYPGCGPDPSPADSLDCAVSQPDCLDL